MHTSTRFADLLKVLVPASCDLRVDTFELDDSHRTIILTLASLDRPTRCPLCEQMATRVHSRYERTLADLPWAHLSVRIQLHVRKLFCDTVDCARRIFTERLPNLVAPWARRTSRLAEQQRHIGMVAGGSAAARLAHHLHHAISRNTVLHLIRTTPKQVPPTPTIIGIDDWSQRRGQTFRTIVVDLERSCPLELLPDREAATVAGWLEAHPEVRIIARDRAGAYADGATKGAPHAIQVADRFHLLRNLQAALVRVLEQHADVVASLATTHPEVVVDDIDGSSVPPVPAVSTPPDPIRSPSQLSRDRRHARYEQIRQLHADGWSQRAIAIQVGVSRDTVQRFVQSPIFPERRAVRRRRSMLDPYTGYLVQRWNEGCHTGTLLYREIRAQGYAGKQGMVSRYVCELRKVSGIAPRKHAGILHGHVRARRVRRRTPIALAWSVLRRPENRDEVDQAWVRELRRQDTALDEAVELVEEFARLVRERGADELDGWLKRAHKSMSPAMRGFAAGIGRDEQAVRAGLSLDWSTGPVEGQINRLKLVKCSMFGRAKLDLLEKRVLYAG